MLKDTFSIIMTWENERHVVYINYVVSVYDDVVDSLLINKAWLANLFREDPLTILVDRVTRSHLKSAWQEADFLLDTLWDVKSDQALDIGKAHLAVGHCHDLITFDKLFNQLTRAISQKDRTVAAEASTIPIVVVANIIIFLLLRCGTSLCWLVLLLIEYLGKHLSI